MPTFLLLSLLVLTPMVDLPAEQVPIFVSTPKEDSLSKYLMDYSIETKDGWLMAILEVSGTGEIKVLKKTPPVMNLNLGPKISDSRSISGRCYFFISYPPFYQNNDAPYRELCELTSSGNSVTCYKDENLDMHDWLQANNGDKVLMFGEPRSDVSWAERGERPFDMILRRISPDGRVVWQWNSRDWLSTKDHVYEDISGHATRFLNNNNKIERVFVKVKSLIQDETTRMLGFLGLLNKPLCVKKLKGCINGLVDDYVHGNSLEWDGDGGIIFSSREQSTIFKIEYPSGKIQWRLGGYGAKHSDFIIQNDPLGGFSAQHSVRKLPNGNILMFDNGNYRHDMHSRAVEYQLDFHKRTATLVWEYRSPDAYSTRLASGAAQRLENGNTLISWGGLNSQTFQKIGTLPIATEVNKEGRVIFEIRSKSFEPNYRVWAE